MTRYMPRIHINTTITVELKLKADEYGIKFSEALRVGIAILLADEGEDKYVNGINVYRKMDKLQTMLQDTNAQIDAIKSKNL